MGHEAGGIMVCGDLWARLDAGASTPEIVRYRRSSGFTPFHIGRDLGSERSPTPYSGVRFLGALPPTPHSTCHLLSDTASLLIHTLSDNPKKLCDDETLGVTVQGCWQIGTGEREEIL